jgi:hypothetical protein
MTISIIISLTSEIASLKASNRELDTAYIMALNAISCEGLTNDEWIIDGPSYDPYDLEDGDVMRREQAQEEEFEAEMREDELGDYPLLGLSLAECHEF